MNASTMNGENTMTGDPRHKTTAAVAPRKLTQYNLTFINVLKSETIKLACAKFTWWCTALIIVIPIFTSSIISTFVHGIVPKGMNPIFLLAQGLQGSKAVIPCTPSSMFMNYTAEAGCNPQEPLNTVRNITTSIFITAILSAAIVFIVFAAKAATRDRKNGSLKGSIIAVPRRNLLIVARLVVVIIYAFIMQIISMIILNIASSTMFSDCFLLWQGQQVHFFNVSINMMILSAICMVFFAIMGYGVGMICKSAAAGTLWLLIVQYVIWITMIVSFICSSISELTHIATMYGGSNVFASSASVTNFITSDPAISPLLNILQFLPSNAANNFLSDAELHTSTTNAFMPNFMISFMYMLVLAAILYGIGHAVERSRNVMK